MEEGYDVMLFLYSTETISTTQRNLALQFNLVGDTFIRMGTVKTVRVASYDVNENAFPEYIEFTFDLPQIFFFPAYNKLPPFKKYIEESVAGTMLNFIGKHADIKLPFPVDVSLVGRPKEDPPKQKKT